MDRVRKRVHKHRQAADLDVTAFMNLMIVLVPVLLISMVFTHTSVIDMNFPAGGDVSEMEPEEVQLEVRVHADRLVVADNRGALGSFPAEQGEHDYEALSRIMQQLKQRLPEKRDIVILLEPEIDYQTLISVMDRVRSYRTVQALSVVNAELFPDISLGDLPGGGAG